MGKMTQRTTDVKQNACLWSISISNANGRRCVLHGDSAGMFFFFCCGRWEVQMKYASFWIGSLACRRRLNSKSAIPTQVKNRDRGCCTRELANECLVTGAGPAQEANLKESNPHARADGLVAEMLHRPSAEMLHRPSAVACELPGVSTRGSFCTKSPAASVQLQMSVC